MSRPATVLCLDCRHEWVSNVSREQGRVWFDDQCAECGSTNSEVIE